MKTKKVVLGLMAAVATVGLASCGKTKIESPKNDSTIETPGGSDTPTNPGGSDTPTNPGGSDTPTNPGGSDTPTNPGGSDTPTNPGGSDTPTNPGGSDTPTNPGGSDTPTNPGGSDTPTNPGGSDTPTNPGGSDTPTNPGGSDTPTSGGGNTSNNGNSEGSLTPGDGIITSKGSINVTSCSGRSESAYVEFESKDSVDDYKVYIKSKKASDSEYKLLNKDQAYIQDLSSSKKRVDVLGLKRGSYSIKLVEVIDGNETNTPSVVDVDVVAYDRSGYAHFKNNEGVGAYNNDGTLKENAIVIYVTDATKNTVELTYKGKTVRGIGNILNTAGQKCGEAGHENECKKVSSGKVYYAKGNENSGILKTLAEDNIPLVIRMVGVISESGLYEKGTYAASHAGLIDGLTDYDSNDYGGSLGDNGHMARMKSAKNVTIEGVGENATLDGWGIHFMCESAAASLGKSFEARNLAFINTPEDALGMEGVQDGSKITASVERVWIHNNTFLAPKISSPAESDKAEGDGSCDFKRGQYFTMSYNYFEYCHKTNLIGSSDSSLQYNITFHHNLWYNCGSRIPLLRQANVHFYNNYIYGDSNDTAGELSYVSSIRANAYMYSENNYYEGCKNVVTDGATVKLYGNTMIQCFGDMLGKVASSRTETMSSNCAYDGQSYANFDTNSSLFYYDSQKGVSDCYLTTADVARQEVIKYAGSNYRTVLNKTVLKATDSNFNVKTPTTAVKAGKITLPTGKSETTVDGIIWSGITGVSSGTVKFKGKAATFKLDTYMTLTIAMTGTSSASLNAGAVVKEDGKVVLLGSGTAVLAPGIYTIISCQKDKDSSITSIEFAAYNSDELKQQLIETYNTAYSAIPQTITYTDACFETIRNAYLAYNNLGDFKSEVSTSPAAALEEFVSLGVAYVEGEINKIGTVDENSGIKITSARSAYNQLLTYSQSAVVSNISVLESAEQAYASYAVTACINAINAIGTVTLDSEAAITLARNLYKQLDENQAESVTNYNVLLDAEEVLNNLKKSANVNALIEDCDMTSIEEMTAVIEAYNNLTTDQKALVNSSISTIKVECTKALINAIGTVNQNSMPAIKAAREMYDMLTVEEANTLGAEYLATLTAAEDEIKNFVQQYNYTISYTTVLANLSNKKYSDDTISVTMSDIDNNTLKIKMSKNDNITISGVVGALKAKLTFSAACLDSSEAKDVSIVVNYADGTSETKILKTATGKSYSNLVLELEGKELKSIVINGISGKNLGVQSISVEYEK